MSKYLRTNLPTQKKNRFVSVSFRQRYPTISEQVAPSLEFKGQFKKGRTVTKAMLGRLSNNPNFLDQLFEATIPRQSFRGNYDL